MYNKLVRDNIPDIIRENGETPIIEVLDNKSYKLELDKKLLEECNEVINSSGCDRLEEIADLLEVVIAILDLEDKTLDDVEKIRCKKREEKGDFSKKIYLKDVK